MAVERERVAAREKEDKDIRAEQALCPNGFKKSWFSSKCKACGRKKEEHRPLAMEEYEDDIQGGQGATSAVDEGKASVARAAAEQQRIKDARLAEETRGDGGCVLIVEDNLMNQKVAKVVVKRCGMRSDVANNGREAIDALTRGGRYDAILMDIQMPVMDGLDATREIRRLEAAGAIPRAPGGGANFIVAVSANATAENHQEGFEAGMDDYITKPIYPTRLRELLMTPRAR